MIKIKQVRILILIKLIVNKDKRRALYSGSKNKHISDSAQILQVVSLTQDTLFSIFLARNFEFR